jgi:hypothetical protein
MIQFMSIATVEDKRRALDAVRAIALPSATHPTVCVEIKPYEETRRLAQNRLHWARLTELAEQCRPEGIEYTPKIWHVYMSERFLPMVEDKLPNGKTVTRRKSTAECTVGEFSDFMTKIAAWAANREIVFTDGGL